MNDMVRRQQITFEEKLNVQRKKYKEDMFSSSTTLVPGCPSLSVDGSD